jgi:ACS family hexuronate transporter-like MFS transporter
MDRVTLNVLSKRILHELDLSKRDYGELESAFAYAFALGAITFGWMADRRSVRWLYPAVLVAWSMAGFATGLVTGFVTLWLCRFALGLCEAGHWPCALKTTQHILPSEQRSLGNGILQSGAALGAILAPLIILFMVQGDERGLWRAPFMVIGAIGCFWAVGWLLTVRRQDLHTQRRPGVSLIGVLLPLVGLLGFDLACRLVIAHPDWLPGDTLPELVQDRAAPLVVKGLVFLTSCLVVLRWLSRATKGDNHLARGAFFRRFFVLMVAVIAINCTWHFFRAWLPLFLQDERGYSEGQATRFITAYYIATDLGSLSIGFASLLLIRAGLATHTSRMVTFTLCALICLLSLVVVVLPAGPLLLGLLLVIGFAALGLFPNYYSFSQELTVQHQGKVTGALGCLNWTAMYFLQDLFGLSREYYGSYAVGLTLAGLTPLVGVVVLVLFWGRSSTK